MKFWATMKFWDSSKDVFVTPLPTEEDRDKALEEWKRERDKELKTANLDRREDLLRRSYRAIEEKDVPVYARGTKYYRSRRIKNADEA